MGVGRREKVGLNQIIQSTPPPRPSVPVHNGSTAKKQQ